MEMLSGVSNFIKKNLSLKQGNSDSGDQAQRPGDRVEDGFLLVGDSASERNTVYTKSYRANQMDLPPGYSEVQHYYQKDQKNSHASNIAVIIIKFENSGFTIENVWKRCRRNGKYQIWVDSV